MKERILSAILIVVVFIPLLVIGDIPFAVFMSFLSVAGLYELIKVRETKKRFPFILKTCAYILVAAFCMNDVTSISLSVFLLGYGIINFLISIAYGIYQ